MTGYQIIYADPPWKENGGGRIKRGADKHYPLMKTEEIMAMKVPCANNAHLYLWVTNNHLQDGFRVMNAWGFRYITTITWIKDKMGLGQYFRGQTEHCLFGVKGSLPYKIINGQRQQGTTFFYAKRGRHSEKPQKMVEIIEKVSDRKGYKKLELFARNKRKGWDVWGNEVFRKSSLSGSENKSPSYYRARIEALRDNDFDLDDLDRKKLGNGFIPEKIKEEFEREVNRLQPNQKNTKLDFTELTSFSTWFNIHPEKIAGIEKGTTSRTFPVKTKGTRKDIDKMFSEFFGTLQKNETEAEALATALKLELDLMTL